MRVKGIVLIVLLLVVGVALAVDGQPGDAGLGDPYYPDLGNGGYDAQHYTIELETDVVSDFIEATVTMEAIALQDLSRFNLDFMGFEIESIIVNDEDATFERDARELIITPAEAIASEDTFTVAVTYSGIPREGVELGDMFVASGGWINYGRGVFVASEPQGASLWIPVNDHPLDKATFTQRITVPDEYVVAANGILQEEIVNEDEGTITYVWDSEHTMATYLVTLQIGDFVRVEEEGPNGIPIRNYFPPRAVEAGTELFSDTAAMMEFFIDLYGPYPFEAYGVAVADAEIPFALETQTMTLFGLGIFASDRAQLTIAHELSHQWIGNSVTPTSWKDIWLNEGFATYSSLLWFEHVLGRDILDQIMQVWYGTIQEPQFTALLTGDPGIDNMFSAGSVYYRGAWVLHALRYRVGDEAFFEILPTYYDRFKYSNASTEDFIAVAEEISGQQLDSFFDLWLYKGTVPFVPELMSP